MLGSAFNPPHNGHLLLARTAREQLDLERVTLVPTGRAPHKEIEDDPGAEVRLRMTELAAEGEEGLEVSAVEAEREGTSYMYETLEELGAGKPGTEWFLILGADAAAGLPEWERPERVVELARPAVAARDGVESEEVAEAMAAVGASDRAEIIAMPRCEASSTMVRKRAAAGEPLEDLVPAQVAEMIEREKLYR